MGRLLAWFTGGLLTASLVAAPVLQAGEDHHGRYNGATATGYRVNGSGYVVNANGEYLKNTDGERVAWPAGGVMMVQAGGMMVSHNGRLYYVHDDPRYDLSGAGKTLVLVDDGGAYKSESWNSSVAFARAGGAPKEVVALHSQYKQHWLAVAAGDRPVRNLSAVPSSPASPAMTFVPVYFAREDAGLASTRNGRTNGYRNSSTAKRSKATYKRTSGTYKRTNGTYKRASATKRNGYRKSSATAATYNGYRNGYRRNGAATASYTADTSNRTRVGTTYERASAEETRDLYQIGNTWYQREGDAWSRSDSWRGPFMAVSKATVPREVKMVEKRPFKN